MPYPSKETRVKGQSECLVESKKRIYGNLLLNNVSEGQDRVRVNPRFEQLNERRSLCFSCTNVFIY